MKIETKSRLNAIDPQAYEKLRQVIKKQTSFENLDEKNITVIKQAYSMLVNWLEEVYSVDTAEINPDEDGMDIDNLFKHN